MVTICIYMQDGRVFHYDVEDGAKARKHAHRIINYGYRNVNNGVMSYYPVHQILKVTFLYQFDHLGTKYKGIIK